MTAPALSLTLSPRYDGAYRGFDVALTMHVTNIAAGTPLLQMPVLLAGVPTAADALSALRVEDSHGPLHVVAITDEVSPGMSIRRWTARRDIVGPLAMKVFAPVRDVDETTRSGPLFDLRAQRRGLLGAGATFIPLPSSEAAFDISLRWDFDTSAFSDVRGVSSRGEGNRRWTGSIDTLAYSFFAAGSPHNYPVGEDRARFGMYSFEDPTFDVDSVARYVGGLHAQMANFFEDDESDFRVFLRRQPGQYGGGTALPRSFMFGYPHDGQVDGDDLELHLAHETAHNWPALDGDHAVTSWYSEGTAEYYSLILPYRAGMISGHRLAQELTRRTSAYCSNPLNQLSNKAAGKMYWSDSRAQRVPYGRGLLYLIETDARIREATGGQHCVDDVVLEILRDRRHGKRVNAASWVERVSLLVGESGRARFEIVAAGGEIDLPQFAMDGCLRSEPTTTPQLELGFDIASFYQEPRLVTGVDAVSAAARAGLRNGDELCDGSIPSYVLDSGGPLRLRIRRNGRAKVVTWDTRGTDVPSTRWVVAETQPAGRGS